MKKLFLSFAVVAGFAMVSCGGEKAQDADAVVVEDEVVADVTEAPDSLNTVVEEAADSLNNAVEEVVDSVK